MSENEPEVMPKGLVRNIDLIRGAVGVSLETAVSLGNRALHFLFGIVHEEPQPYNSNHYRRPEA